MEQPKNIEELTPPEEFNKIINDFTSDILLTFPEYSGVIGRWWNRKHNNNYDLEENKRRETLFVFRHCVKIIPERFFDILYQNNDIFLDDSVVNTEFLPGIVFKQLWTCDISENTKTTIWKYLQLILFSVIGTVNDTSQLGDTAKLFEAINEDELKTKLEETFSNIQNIFDSSFNPMDSNDAPNINLDNMPKPEQIHEHINSMMNGKLGKLAIELAEETANDLNLDLDNVTNATDVFQKLFKNPGKLMNMVKNIGNKIDQKLQSGEIKQSELMEEGMELLNKMKDMPGMDNMQKLFSQMGLGKGAKMNMGAMQSQLNQNIRTAKMKERYRSKVEAKKQEQQQQQQQQVFTTGETVEKTPRGTKPPLATTQQKKKKNKK